MLLCKFAQKQCQKGSCCKSSHYRVVTLACSVTYDNVNLSQHDYTHMEFTSRLFTILALF